MNSFALYVYINYHYVHALSLHELSSKAVGAGD